MTRVRPGVAGVVLVIALQFGLVTCMDVFNPVMAVAGGLILATPALLPRPRADP